LARQRDAIEAQSLRGLAIDPGAYRSTPVAEQVLTVIASSEQIIGSVLL